MENDGFFVFFSIVGTFVLVSQKELVAVAACQNFDGQDMRKQKILAKRASEKKVVGHRDIGSIEELEQELGHV